MSSDTAISAKRGLGMVGVIALAASALVGGNAFSLRDRLLGSAVPAPRPVAVSPFVRIHAGAKPRESVLRSQPWWQGVARWGGGVGRSTRRLTIGNEAIQWRLRWRCTAGRLTVAVVGQAAPLVDSSCPGHGTAHATRTGDRQLAVSAGGAWSLYVDQQVNVPLVQPPLPAMTAPGTSIAFRGDFQRIDQSVTGRVNFYRLRSDRYLLRLVNFYVTPNVDLELRLSPLVSPHSTAQFLSSASVEVAPLNITAGSLNFAVPAAIDPARYRSLVIWCPLIRSAYAEAPLRGGP